MHEAFLIAAVLRDADILTRFPFSLHGVPTTPRSESHLDGHGSCFFLNLLNPIHSLPRLPFFAPWRPQGKRTSHLVDGCLVGHALCALALERHDVAVPRTIKPP